MKKLILIIILLLSFNAYALEGPISEDMHTFPKWNRVIKEQPLPKIYTNQVVTIDDLIKINKKVNHLITYKNAFDRQSIWQTPNESLILGTGNCADYSILKLYALSKLGVSLNNMLVVTGDYYGQGLHAVLEVTLSDGHAWVLDSLTDKVQDAKTYYHEHMHTYYGITQGHWIDAQKGNK